MIITGEVIDAIAANANIVDRDEATRLVHMVAPHYRHGQLTGRVLAMACRFLYAGFDRYPVETQARLRREAREILRCGEDIAASPDPVHV